MSGSLPGVPTAHPPSPVGLLMGAVGKSALPRSHRDPLRPPGSPNRLPYSAGSAPRAPRAQKALPGPCVEARVYGAGAGWMWHLSPFMTGEFCLFGGPSPCARRLEAPWLGPGSACTPLPTACCSTTPRARQRDSAAWPWPEDLAPHPGGPGSRAVSTAVCSPFSLMESI